MHLYDFTRDVIDWMLDPVNWYRFCQHVQAEARLHHTPPHPQVGFLLKHRTRAVRLMRVELQHSTAAAHVSFCARLDHRDFVAWKSCLLVAAVCPTGWQKLRPQTR